MAAVARRLLLRPGVGERLLTAKLQILNGTAGRRPAVALGVLTGRTAEHLSLMDNVESIDDVYSDQQLDPVVLMTVHRRRRRYAAHTVYLSEHHLSDVDRVIEAWQQVEPRRLTRSAVVRRAVEYLRAAVEADPAKTMLEND
jgi:hypothetical protein